MINKKDKQGLQFKSALFAFVIVGVIIFGVGTWIDQWNQDYSSNITYDLRKYDKSNEMYSYSSTSKLNLAPQSSFDSGEGTDFEGTSLRGAFGIINKIFLPFNFLTGTGGLLDSVEDQFGIPEYITQAVTTLILFAVIFSIIALFFRKATPA